MVKLNSLVVVPNTFFSKFTILKKNNNHFSTYTRRACSINKHFFCRYVCLGYTKSVLLFMIYWGKSQEEKTLQTNFQN